MFRLNTNNLFHFHSGGAQFGAARALPLCTRALADLAEEQHAALGDAAGLAEQAGGAAEAGGDY